MIDYLRLLLEFQKLPEAPRVRTFMDVSGYPHYENVSSNLLAFFFDPEEEHGLSDLLLASFISLCGKEAPSSTVGLTIHREHGTDDGGRLDLLIEREGFVIGIENKIYHHPANNFPDYSALIDGRGLRDCVRIKAVLSLKPIRDNDKLTSAGFVSITYGQLWEAVREKMGRYIHAANPKWLSYLIDFMETTSRLAGENKSMEEMDKFLIERHELIGKLFAELARFQQRLDSQLVVLKDMLEHSNAARQYPVEFSMYQSSMLMLDFRFDGHVIVLNLRHTLKEVRTPPKWQLRLALRDNKSCGYLQKIIGKEPLCERMQTCKSMSSPYDIADWSLDTSAQKLSDELCSWMEALLASADAQRLAAGRDEGNLRA